MKETEKIEQAFDSPQQMQANFEKELEILINRHCQENISNTPDFILAQYILGCLAIFNIAIQQREAWYGRDPRSTLNTQVNYTGKKDK